MVFFLIWACWISPPTIPHSSACALFYEKKQPQQQEKIIQLYRMLPIHHCVMVVGSTSGGKSFIINTVIQLQIRLGITAKRVVLNPKVNLYLIGAPRIRKKLKISFLCIAVHSHTFAGARARKHEYSAIIYRESALLSLAVVLYYCIWLYCFTHSVCVYVWTLLCGINDKLGFK